MAQGSAPVKVQYFYTIKWGYQGEFLDLFKRNHWPLLQVEIQAGRMLEVKAYEPRFHGDGRQDWTLMTEITYRNWQALEDHMDPAIAARLFPDQEKFRKEEQQRFDLVVAHWDVILEDYALPK